MQNNGEHKTKRGLLNIRIIVPFGGPPSPLTKKVAQTVFYLMAVVMLLIAGGATLGIAFFGGYTFSKVQERLDAPLQYAAIGSPEQAMRTLEAQSRYLADVAQLYPVAIVAGERTSEILQSRSTEVQKLQLEAAALQGKVDADSLRKFQELRSRVRSMPKLAGTVTWQLLRENLSIGLLVYLAAIWICAFMNFAGPLTRLFRMLDTLGKKKASNVPAAA